MTKPEFLNDYRFTCEVSQDKTKIITRIVRRSDNTTIDSVNTVHDFSKTTNSINDSHYAATQPWNWDKLIEETQRFQLDYFAQKIPITGYYPLDKQSYPNISDLYQ